MIWALGEEVKMDRTELVNGLITAGVIVMVAGPVLAVLILIDRKRRQQLRGLADGFGGRLVFRPFHPFVRFDDSGCLTEIHVRHRSKRNPSNLIIQRMRPLDFKLTIDPKILSPRRKIRIIRLQEVLPRDPELNKNYIIRSNNPKQVLAILEDPRRKQELDLFFQTMKFIELSADKSKLILTKFDFEQTDLESEQLEQVVDALRSFACAATTAED
jgi:hypothetical protein